MPSVPDRDERPRLREALRAFRYRNFAIFWTGALLSNTGTWIQGVTVPYVLYQLTGSAAWVGLGAFAQFLPFMVMGPLAGSLADRFSRRQVLVVTQAAAAVVALALWLLWEADLATPGVIVAMVALGGVAAGLNVPAWQAFVTELVPRDALLNAITLNSAQFNGARALGPAVGGAVIATLGPSWAFLINALSYVAVLGALALVRVPPLERVPAAGRVLSQFAEGVRYTRAHTGIALCIVVVTVVAFLGSPVFQLAPVFAEEVFEVGPGWYGVLTGALGTGAVLGAPVVASWGTTVSRGRLAGGALLLYSASIVAFGLSPVLWVGIVALAVAGAGYLAVVSTLMTTMQLLVDEQMRGRVLAIYFMGFTGAYPLGSLIQGWVADRVGAPATTTTAGLLLLGLVVWLRVRPGLLASLEGSGDEGSVAFVDALQEDAADVAVVAQAAPPAPGPGGAAGLA